MPPTLSPRQLADAIGVSESTVKRWIDDGRIEADRTVGGHRRVLLPEAVRFVREQSLHVVRPDLIGLDEVPPRGVDGDSVETLFEMLRHGTAEVARGIVLGLYLQGRSVAEIIDAVVAPAMERVGELWRHSPEGIFYEHRATDICLAALQQLRVLLPVGRGPVAVGGGLGGDPYLMPSLAVASVLEDLGYRATNLGPDTPAATFQWAIEELRPAIVWISLSGRSTSRRRQEVREVLGLAEEHRIPLVVGGRRTAELDLANHPSLVMPGTLRDLAAWAAARRA